MRKFKNGRGGNRKSCPHQSVIPALTNLSPWPRGKMGDLSAPSDHAPVFSGDVKGPRPHPRLSWAEVPEEGKCSCQSTRSHASRSPRPRPQQTDSLQTPSHLPGHAHFQTPRPHRKTPPSSNRNHAHRPDHTLSVSSPNSQGPQTPDHAPSAQATPHRPRPRPQHADRAVEIRELFNYRTSAGTVSGARSSRSPKVRRSCLSAKREKRLQRSADEVSHGSSPAQGTLTHARRSRAPTTPPEGHRRSPVSRPNRASAGRTRADILRHHKMKVAQGAVKADRSLSESTDSRRHNRGGRASGRGVCE
ncbi:serine/arginine repetitive matrix protein 1-like [Grammomys surdaster]|uniref:serine/arginine repetitive matrix protein 1-like n=1 Tax=Grammomys surdaster TaxID=491861 RepID=UPI00109F197D|nr:serine/arginine repetitive matrix protein 1-like [Grammomys surdaster]